MCEEMRPGREKHYFLSSPPQALCDFSGLGEWQKSYSTHSAQGAKAVAWMPEITG